MGASEPSEGQQTYLRGRLEELCQQLENPPPEGGFLGLHSLLYTSLHGQPPKVIVESFRAFVEPITGEVRRDLYGFDLVNQATGRREGIGLVTVLERGLRIHLKARILDPVPDWMCPTVSWTIPRNVDTEAVFEQLKIAVRLVGLELILTESEEGIDGKSA